MQSCGQKGYSSARIEIAKDVKNHKSRFFSYLSSKQKHREGTGPLLHRAGNRVTNNADKADVLKTVFTGIAGLQITASSSYNDVCVDPPVVEGGLVCLLLQGLNPHKSMGLGRIHPRVLREVADIIVVRPLSIIFEKL